MAIVGFLVGSIVGVIFGLVGLFAFDISTWKAFLLYMMTALSSGMLLALLLWLRRTGKDKAQRGSARY